VTRDIGRARWESWGEVGEETVRGWGWKRRADRARARRARGTKGAEARSWVGAMSGVGGARV